MQSITTHTVLLECVWADQHAAEVRQRAGPSCPLTMLVFTPCVRPAAAALDQAVAPLLVQRGVPTAALNQLRGRAVLNDPASLDNQHPVGDLDSGEPVGDHERGTVG